MENVFRYSGQQVSGAAGARHGNASCCSLCDPAKFTADET